MKSMELRRQLPGRPAGRGRLLATGSVLTATVTAILGAITGAAQAAQAVPASASGSGGTIRVCPCTTWMAADSATGTLWLVNGKAKAISVVSEKTRKVVATIKLALQLGPDAIGSLAVDPSSRTVWDFAGGDLVEISDKTMKVVHILKPKGYRPGFSGTVDPARGEVWAVSEETIQGISESTGKVLSTIFIADGAKQDTIVGVAADQKTGTVLAAVNKFGGTRTWLFDINEANSFAAVRKLPGLSAGLAVDPSAGLAWNLKGTTLSGYSIPGKLKPSGSIAIGASRLGAMAADPATGSLWMAASNGKVLTRFSESHRSVLKTLPLPGRSFGITVDSKSRTVFTLNTENHVIQFYRY
jgi:hypothetical protein